MSDNPDRRGGLAGKDDPLPYPTNHPLAPMPQFVCSVHMLAWAGEQYCH